jgi:hypothetical protein
MKESETTLHGILVNRRLLWDCAWPDADYKSEDFFKWYLARVLANGTADDLRAIDFKIIKRYLDALIGIPGFVREFWQWYLHT